MSILRKFFQQRLLVNESATEGHLVHAGCGRSPINGWLNFDNSISVSLAKMPTVPEMLHLLKLLNDDNLENIRWLKANRILFADATRHIPIRDGSAACLYSCHMLEHLSPRLAKSFLAEAFRVLNGHGIIRIVVPDLQNNVKQYLENGDADSFIRSLDVCSDMTGSMRERLRLLVTGTRNHQWYYDSKSLCELIKKSGFVNVEVMERGQTKIQDPGELDLDERFLGSVVVEGVKPLD